ncbi:hypothetical protein J7E71_01975 [Mesobacillus foraminis]|uniref:hypothetical protein n=1 Tax=Mesobacillus foraminis TaxID=279826 RepID=UPI001BE51A26|nr:hypothetical protein [Mesobacillus foraminis]MBT2754713.1 hypothetical protein [Mesobacillus foraminis]
MPFFSIASANICSMFFLPFQKDVFYFVYALYGGVHLLMISALCTLAKNRQVRKYSSVIDIRGIPLCSWSNTWGLLQPGKGYSHSIRHT